MVNQLQKKLHSNRGASMILALALFLICTMVSSVIIAAAASGVSRNAQRAEQQNGYLAVSSAADLIMEELQTSGQYAGASVKKYYGCQDCSIPSTMEYFGVWVSGYRLDASYIPNPLDDGHLMISVPHTDLGETKSMDTTNTTLSGTFGELFKRAANHVYMNGTAYGEQITIALQMSDERIPDVICDFTMDSSYNVTFALSTENSDYSISIGAVAIIYQREPIRMQDDSDVHTVYFKRFNETQGIFEDAEIQLMIPVEVTTTITEISWGVPQVEKGVLSQ